jgi:hypothetical protein
MRCGHYILDAPSLAVYRFTTTTLHGRYAVKEEKTKGASKLMFVGAVLIFGTVVQELLFGVSVKDSLWTAQLGFLVIYTAIVYMVGVSAGDEKLTHEEQDPAFDKWLEKGDIALPNDPESRKLSIDALRIAFNAGWAGCR